LRQRKCGLKTGDCLIVVTAWVGLTVCMYDNNSFNSEGKQFY